MKNSDNSREFVIVCPGKSLDRPEMQLIYNIPWNSADCVIAVNGAVGLPLLFDYWIFQDIEVFRTMRKDPKLLYDKEGHPLGRFAEALCLIVPGRMLEDVRSDHNDLTEDFFNFRLEAIPGKIAEDFSHYMPFGKDIKWREFTMTAAIGMAILKGATKIRIFGADLKGSGYFRPGLENDRTRHDQKRWQEEIAIFDRIVSEAKDHNIEIKRELL